MRCPHCGIAGSVFRTADGSWKCGACKTSGEFNVQSLTRGMGRKQAGTPEPTEDPDIITDSLDGQEITYVCRRSADKHVPVLEFNEARGRFHRWRAQRERG